MISSRWQAWKIDAKVVTPADAAARELALAQFGLELGQDGEVARLRAEHRHAEFDHLKTGDRAEHFLYRGHHIGQSRTLLQRDPFVDRMDEQPAQIVESFGEELGDRVHVERRVTLRVAPGGQRDFLHLDLAARAPGDDARRAGTGEPLDRVERDPSRRLRVAALELLDAAAQRVAAHDLVAHPERVEHLQHQERDMRRLDDVAAGVEDDVRRSRHIRRRRAASG